MSWCIDHGDSRRVLATMPDASVDACVTDPPYEINMMGRAWDRSGIAFEFNFWRQVWRTMRPGAHLAAFGFPRTYHRLACAVEDAGFEIRDSLHWLYGNGYQKNVNLGEGRGTGLRPAHEPIVLARKPLDGTLVENLARWGTAALNIDACRSPGGDGADDPGRWPKNVLLSHALGCEGDDCLEGCPVLALRRQGGVRKSGANPARRNAAKHKNVYGAFAGQECRVYRGADVGTVDRTFQAFGWDAERADPFLYCSKVSKSERDAGCEAFPFVSSGEATGGRKEGSAGIRNARAGAGRSSPSRNDHPTLKPIALLGWLVRLLCPPGGLVLDPFSGAGSTGSAAVLEGRHFHGIELAEHFFELGLARVEHWDRQAAERDRLRSAVQHARGAA